MAGSLSGTTLVVRPSAVQARILPRRGKGM